MGTDTGREIIISLRVSVGFLGPEFITEDRIEIKPTFQRLECKRIVQLLSPWNVILLQGKCHLGVIRRIAWNEPQENIRFPLMVLTI